MSPHRPRPRPVAATDPTDRPAWGAAASPWLLAAQLQFTAATVLFRAPLPLAIVATVGLGAATVVGCHHLLRAGAIPPARSAWLSRAGLALVGGFLTVVLAVCVVVYPVVGAGRDPASGIDVDDAVLIVLDGLQRGVDDPLAVETYLGNPVTTGPGALVWFSPFGTEARYPLGIFAAVVGLVVLLRRWTGSWFEPSVAAVLLTVSVPFWLAVAQGADRVPFACGLAAAAVYFDRRPAVVPPWAATAAAVGLGVLATFRFAYLHVPLLVGAALWQQGRRRLALAVGLGGTAVAALLHGALIARSSWEGYTPVHFTFTKSQDELNDLGRALLAAALVATVVALVVALRRPGGPRVATMLLIGIGGPMTGIVVAGLAQARATDQWGTASYAVECIVLAAVVAAAAVARRSSPPSPASPPGSKSAGPATGVPVRTAGGRGRRR